MDDRALYHKWLGIPPQEQPANHYRLLGVSLFENDPTVIENAADQRVSHLRTLRTSQQSDISERMINEVVVAKLCLLRADRKAQYDATLRAAWSQPVSPPLLASPSTPTSGQSAVEPATSYESLGIEYQTIRAAAPTPKRSRATIAFIVAPIAGITLVVCAIAYNNSTAESDPPPQTAQPAPAAVTRQSSRSVVRDDHQASRKPGNPRGAAHGWLKPIPGREVLVNAEMGVGPIEGSPAPVRLNLVAPFVDLVTSVPVDAPNWLHERLASLWSAGRWGVTRLKSALVKSQSRTVDPIVLKFDQDDVRAEFPIGANVPNNATLYVAVWKEGEASGTSRLVLQQQPDPIEISCDAMLINGKSRIVVIKASPRIGAGNNAIPCNLNRLSALTEGLPGQIQNAQDKLSEVESDISRAEAIYKNIVTQSVGQVGANPAAAIARQSGAAAAKSRLQMLYGKRASLIRSGTRWTTQLQELPALTKTISGFVGMQLHFQVYYVIDKQKVIVLETDPTSATE